MRLVPFIACLLIASAAGCGPAGGRRDADTSRQADADADATSTTAPLRSEETAQRGAGRTSTESRDAAGADALVEAAETAATACAGCAERPVDPAESEEDAARERERTALLLSVQVRDRRTGQPLAGAMVDNGTTDAAGRIEMRRPLPERGERIEVHCPSRHGGFMRSALMQSKAIGSAPFIIQDGSAKATIEVDASVCVEPVVHTERRRFAGIYDSGFENSTFLPCEGMPAEAAYYDRVGFYWANVPVGIGAALDKSVGGTQDNWRHGRRFYVEWLGTATGPGIHGHTGMSLYDLDVEALYKVSAEIPATCHPAELREFPFPPPPPPPPSKNEDGNPRPVTS